MWSRQECCRGQRALLLSTLAIAAACGNVSHSGELVSNSAGASGDGATEGGTAAGGVGAATAGGSSVGGVANAGTSTAGAATGGSMPAAQGGQPNDGGTAGGAGDGGAGGASDGAVCVGDRQITGAVQYANLLAEHCREITGALQFLRTTTLETAAGLDSLTKVGSLRLHGNEGLTSLAILSHLESVDHDVVIYSNHDLKSLAGLDRLTHVGGTIQLNGSNSSLTSLQGLASLAAVDGSLLLYAPLASLTGLHVKKVGQDLSILGSRATSLAGLDELTSVGGTLSISGNPLLASLSPLSDSPADAVGGDISIKDNPLLPQCQVDAFDAAQVDAVCVGCTGNQAACN